MQIIVDNRTEMKYYRQCLEQINNKYSRNIVVDKYTVIDICDLCIETLVQDFTTFLDRYQNPQDLFQFMLLYSNLATEKQRSENTLILMQMCRYVFMLIPKLKLSSQATPIIDIEKSDLSDIFFITKMIDILAQQRAIQIINEKCIFQLERSEFSFALTYVDNSLVKAHTILNQTNQKKSLFQKHCFTSNLLNDFRDELYNAFGDITDKLFEVVCNIQSVDICHNKFNKIIEGYFPKNLQILRIINISQLFIEHLNNSFLQGLLFSSNNSDIITAVKKPYNKDLRTRYRPILEFNIDGEKEYFIAPYMFQEAMEEICGNLLPFNELPSEWRSNHVIKKFTKKLFQEHDKWLEDLAAEIFERDKYPFLRNKKSINNISLEKVIAYIGSIRFPNFRVGEIDFIVINKSTQIIYVIDAKHIKTKYHLQSFAADNSKFVEENGYNDKLSFKVDWIQKHLYDVSKEFECDYSNYSVQGALVTETFVYYSISSQFPIIPIAWLNKYLKTNDKLCFLRQ